MTRLAVAAALLLTGVTAHGAHADPGPDDDVDPVALAGALNSLADAGIDINAQTYLAPAPEPVAAPPVNDGWPIGGELGQRIYCIEGYESHHGVAMWNPTPVGGEHAQGYLGWLPSTASSVGVVIGNRTSEWSGAARMIGLGRGREFYGIRAGIC